MPARNTSPATTTATRSGYRVVVTRTDDGLIAGAEPIISVLSGTCDIMNLAPSTALELSGMLARAATTEIAVKIRVTNTYPGEAFEHVYDVVAPAPRDEYTDDWAFDHLWEHTGEGPEYANTPAAYEVEILGAPEPFAHLVGLTVDSYG
ncbi:hypothetical protein WKY82_08295 [Gordonia malaquae]|uniref:hypothetical protein n=1 Tax=Gordonia malaquae TaxID=410332 RepID=UPI0030C7A0A0